MYHLFVHFISLNYKSSIRRAETLLTAVAAVSKHICWTNEWTNEQTAVGLGTGSSDSTGPKIVTTFCTLMYNLNDYKMPCEAATDGTVGSITV